MWEPSHLINLVLCINHASIQYKMFKPHHNHAVMLLLVLQIIDHFLLPSAGTENLCHLESGVFYFWYHNNDQRWHLNVHCTSLILWNMVLSMIFFGNVRETNYFLCHFGFYFKFWQRVNNSDTGIWRCIQEFFPYLKKQGTHSRHLWLFLLHQVDFAWTRQ